MKFLKYMFAVIGFIGVLASSCLFYAFKIEPYRLRVHKYELSEKNVNLTPVKIVQFSDVHIKADFTAKSLDKIVTHINKQNPDILVFTGDLYDNYAQYNDDVNIIAKLNEMQARYAKIAIWGNRDYGGGAARQYANIMEQAGFTLLKNENWYVTVENNKKLLFTGLDDSMLGNVYMPDDTKLYEADYDILLTHEPDTIEEFREYTYDITLSGHSHGGQVNIPFLPAINEKAVSITSLSTKYAGGMYTLDATQNSKLYVNTGIGTTHISARFGVVPEISVFQIYI